MGLKPCLDCGRITTGSRCPSCRRQSPYQQPEWRRLSDFVVARDGSCRECGSRRYLAAHHVIPRKEGGADHPSNLIALCASCHARLEAPQRAA
jgi:5-methylcytosine-specific restriction endonuclease McrA